MHLTGRMYGQCVSALSEIVHEQEECDNVHRLMTIKYAYGMCMLFFDHMYLCTVRIFHIMYAFASS